MPQLTLKRRSLGPSACTGEKSDMPSAPSMRAASKKAVTFSSRPARVPRDLHHPISHANHRRVINKKKKRHEKNDEDSMKVINVACLLEALSGSFRLF